MIKGTLGHCCCSLIATSPAGCQNAFLYGDLSEDVYITPLPSSPQLSQVCKLCRALYGLKQAPGAWFEKFSLALLQLSFNSSHHDSGLFIRRGSTGITILLLYVDDMIITRDDQSGISKL